jgi:hypothetical protein
MFFIAGSGRILGGTQDTLEVLSESGEADMGDKNVSLGHIMGEATQEALMSAAETAFNKNNGQLMKFITVGAMPLCVLHTASRVLYLVCVRMYWGVQIPFINVSSAFAARCSPGASRTVMVEACLQVTLFLEDGSLLPRMTKESFRYYLRSGLCSSTAGAGDDGLLPLKPPPPPYQP